MNAPALNKDASLLPAETVCQQQTPVTIGSTLDSNAKAVLDEALSCLLRALAELGAEQHKLRTRLAAAAHALHKLIWKPA